MKDFSKLYLKRNCEYELNNGVVTVLYKKEKLNFIEKTFFKKLSSKPYKIDLDEIGSFIWMNIQDGIIIEKLIELSKKEFGEKIEPANERVELFIQQMNKNNLVKLYEKRGNNEINKA